MTKQHQPSATQGEGSYEGARRYNEHVKKHVQNDDIHKQAEEAKTALEGDERQELEEAGSAGSAARRSPEHATRIDK